MDFFYKKLLFISALAATCAPLFGYQLIFGNMTDKTLIIMSKKRAGIQERYYQIVRPGGSVIQVWNDANCLESLQWAELDQKLPRKGGLDFVDPNQSGQIPSNKQTEFDETIFSKTSGKGLYLWNTLPIVMTPVEIFNILKKDAVTLFKGFDKTVCFGIQELLLALKDAIFAAMKTALDALEEQLKVALADQADGIKKHIPAVAQKTADDLVIKLQAEVTVLRTKVETYVKNKINQAIDKKECLFNLAQIAEAAGKIEGISICKKREFILMDTQQKDDLTDMPLLIATTEEGD